MEFLASNSKTTVRVVSNSLYFYPYLGKGSNLIGIFETGSNHQLGYDCKHNMCLAFRI